MGREKKKKKSNLKNITINIPNIYDKGIQKLIKMKLVASRSEAIRLAVKSFLQNEYNNLQILGYFDNNDENLREVNSLSSKPKI